MIIRKAGTEWVVKDFGRGAKSRRLILPGRDGCDVKVTEFSAPKGWESEEDIFYEQTEVVRVLSGQVKLTLGEIPLTSQEWEKILGPGDVYVVRARESYAVEVLEDLLLYCVFCPQPGPLPDDE